MKPDINRQNTTLTNVCHVKVTEIVSNAKHPEVKKETVKNVL